MRTQSRHQHIKPTIQLADEPANEPTNQPPNHITNQPSNQPPKNIPDKCKLPEYVSLVQAKCGVGKENPVHVLAASYLGLIITFPEKQKTSYVAVILNNTLSNGTFYAANLPDYRNDTLPPLEGIFNPTDRTSDRSRSPRYIYTFQIPMNLSSAAILNKMPVDSDGGEHPSLNETYVYPFFQITYNTYSGPQNSSYISSIIVKNLTIDTDKSKWITPIPLLPSAPPPSVAAPESKLADAVYAIIICGSVGIVFVLSIFGYSISRKRQANRLSRFSESRMDLYNHLAYEHNESGLSMDELRSKKGLEGSGKALSYRKLTNSSMNREALLDDTQSDDENAAIVFKKSYNGSYAASITSSTYPRSILKTQQMVESEALNAQMYDPIIVTSYRPPSRNQPGLGPTPDSVTIDLVDRNENLTPMSKRVIFKETVDTAIVDLSMPPALDAVPNGLFDDSEDEDAYGEEGGDNEEDGMDQLHFNDGGVEKDIRKLLSRKLELDDEYDSEAEDNDEWKR
ncbi:hypothetical protein CcCBS67573_g01702 [Chytriomyces confervae]|uniref:Uncharacterized protein n=1 Tax=Chytriomyces confervae TaxID=246404 RepID=A0A507FN32_9FUNG|nr:hypothetical protein CcCBS67573_g01702 [Chytriomyces confervae]